MKNLERLQQVEELFHAALEREPNERAAFLSEACGSDATLLAEVESLLPSDARTGRFFYSPAFATTDEPPADFSAELLIGKAIGSYKVLNLLGKGGMGEVYLAVEQRLNRRVALKILPAAFSHDPESLARFHREASLAASLNHPNICGVYEINEADG